MILVESETDPEHGCMPHQRPMEKLLMQGVINLDKPPGPTSHEIVSWVKVMLAVPRTGQGGTLDPGVTGVLPIALGDATKGLRALLEGGKEYVCVMKLHKNVEENKLRKAFEDFTTKIYQTPPLRSAVKRERRIREVYYTEVMEVKKRDVLFKIGCEAGTYVRTFAEDIGTALGTGGNLFQLRRTKSARFLEDDAHTLHDLKDAFMDWKADGKEEAIRKIILPMEAMFVHLPKFVVRDSAVDAVCHGADLAVPGLCAVSEGVNRGNLVCVETLKGEAVALAMALKSTEELLKEKKGIAANLDRVMMNPGTYAKMWKSGTNDKGD